MKISNKHVVKAILSPLIFLNKVIEGVIRVIRKISHHRATQKRRVNNFVEPLLQEFQIQMKPINQSTYKVLKFLPFYNEKGILPFKRKWNVLILITSLVIFIFCTIQLCNKYEVKGHLWLFLISIGIFLILSGLYWAMSGIGVYLKRTLEVNNKKEANHYRDLAIHDGMRAMVAVTIANALFTLAMIL